MIFGSHGSPPEPREFILCLPPGVVLEGRVILEEDGVFVMYLSPPDDVLGRVRVSFMGIGRNWQSEAASAELWSCCWMM